MFDEYFDEISNQAVRARWSRLMKAVEEKKTSIDKSTWLQAIDCKHLKLFLYICLILIYFNSYFFQFNIWRIL